MARFGFAVVCGFLFLVAINVTARAGQPCSGVVITDMIETAAGERTAVGEQCFEPETAGGFPFYYDAPGKNWRGLEPAYFYSATAYKTHSRLQGPPIEAVGHQSITELTNPFPPGQGEAGFRPE